MHAPPAPVVRGRRLLHAPDAVPMLRFALTHARQGTTTMTRKLAGITLAEFARRRRQLMRMAGPDAALLRSEERRVGEEGGREGRPHRATAHETRGSTARARSSSQ